MKNSALFVLCALLTACGGSDDNKTTNQTTIQSYTITTNVEGEGQLQPTSLVLKQGESGTFELQPEQGHKVASVEGCNGTYSNNIYTIESAAQSCQVTAKFEAKTINVALKSDAYITLNTDKNDYAYGDSAVISYELSSGYLLNEITGCNGALNDELYKVDALTTDCQITATTLPTSQLFSGEDEAQVNVTVLDGKGSILSSSKGIIESSTPELPALNSSLEFERDLLAVDIATEAGQTIELQITYENPLPTQFTYQKLIGQQWQALDQENVAVSEDRLTLTLTLTDGGAGDSDGVINGVIKDPGGPAVVKMHTVTINQSAGGAITPESLAVAHGDTALFTISTDAGYTLESVTGCNGILNGTSYQTAAITQYCEISAEFSLTSFLVTAQAGEGGQISPLEQLASYGDTLTFTVTADDDHNIESVQGCDGSLAGNIYTTGIITAACEVRATFDPQTVLVTAQAGMGGSISPMSQELNIGQQASLIVTPNEGYSIANVTGCSGSLNGNTYTTSTVTVNCQVQASFSINSYTVTANAGEGGTVTPATQSVNHDSSAQITITPNEGYSIDAVTGCSGSLSGTTYTTSAVTTDCEVQASFSINSYTVSASAGEGGAVNPTTQSVNHGSSAQITITPNEGYSINAATGCNGSLSGNTYTTGEVTSNCEVQASFSINSYTVSASAGEGGAVTPTTQSVNYGSSAQVTVTTDEGYMIERVYGCEGGLVESVFTTGLITSQCSVTAEFKIIPKAPIISAQASVQSITVSWDSLDNIEGYTLYYVTSEAITPDNYNDLGGVKVELDTSANAHELTNLQSNTTYYIIMTSHLTGTESDISNKLAITTQLKVMTLNDTGITWCADSSSNKPDCPATGHEGQDAEYGRDAQAKAGILEKVGGGNAGFDFTKLDANGNDLSESASAWSCVRDNHTGLIWEVKTDDGGLHDKHDHYNWYNPDSNNNGGSPGYQKYHGDTCYGYDASNSATYCNTYAYVERVNTQSLCGASDWRMPTRSELMGIVDNSIIGPAVDTQYFPLTRSSHFWSSSSYAGDSDSAWVVSFNLGYVFDINKYGNGHVRLVRGRP
ncbi:DUF1566 domain-containing protein [Pseudoalteromonas neustonica]|uniref:DUF1566 domain-containing protein n=1 Tax=Pseudoalteromonas neustonica TaxID=1840331 RepID=A0ABU9TZM0_9GAMM